MAFVDASPQRSRHIAPWVSTAARLILAGVLIVAGYLKWRQPHVDQIRAVQAYEIVTNLQVVDLIAVMLPYIEMLVGFLLLVGMFVRASAVVSAVVMAVFIAGIASVWIRGLNIDCGCFGSGGTTTAEGRNLRYGTEIARDVGFLLCAAWLIAKPRSRLALVDRADSASIA